MRVAPANTGQFQTWDGNLGDFWTDWADRFDDGAARYHQHLLTAAAIDPATTVLDIGCGNGRTTRDAARQATDGTALGVDLSASMITRARQLAAEEHLRNATFLQADAQVHPFPAGGFDLAISRHGAMFFGDPHAAFGNIARAVRPGGRIVLITWQPLPRNEFITAFRAALAAGRDLPAPAPDAPGPFSLSDPDQVTRLLTASGFTGVRLTALAEPMYFGRDVEDAFRFVSAQHAGLLHDLDADTAARARDNLRASLAGHHSDAGVHYDSAAWLIEAHVPGNRPGA